MFCIHCGKEIEADSKFCVHCGQDQSSSPTTTSSSKEGIKRQFFKKPKRLVISGIAVLMAVGLVLWMTSDLQTDARRTLATDALCTILEQELNVDPNEIRNATTVETGSLWVGKEGFRAESDVDIGIAPMARAVITFTVRPEKTPFIAGSKLIDVKSDSVIITTVAGKEMPLAEYNVMMEEYYQAIEDVEAETEERIRQAQESLDMTQETHSPSDVEDTTDQSQQQYLDVGPYVTDFLGRTLGEVIGIYGENFTLPDGGYNGSRYIYFDAIPFTFFFNPFADTPSDEDIIVAVMVSSDGMILPGISADSTLEELQIAFGDQLYCSFDEGYQCYTGIVEFYDYKILFEWRDGEESPTGAATKIQAILK